MKGDSNVLMALNKALTAKLTAINQYFLHARMHRNWGFESLNDHIYKASIHEMKHADKIIERILLLEGLPNLQDLGKLNIGEDAHEAIKTDMQMQAADIKLLRDTVTLCEKHDDFVSRDMLTSILEQQEDHLDWLETQEELISSIGVKNYLQTQV